MSYLQTRIDTLRGELREEKEYATALEESKRDAERLLSKKIEELSEARKEIDQLRTALAEPQQEGRGERRVVALEAVAKAAREWAETEFPDGRKQAAEFKADRQALAVFDALAALDLQGEGGR